MPNRSFKPREVLASDSPNRFKVDKPLLRQVYNYLKSYKSPNTVALIPRTLAQHFKCSPLNTVAAILAASEQFSVQGFYVTEVGLQWAEHPDVPVLARAYAYLSYLLQMDSNTVELLFGQQCPNDLVMHQWDPYPETAHGLLLARLKNYLQMDSAICLD